jgi:hypothetical protein
LYFKKGSPLWQEIHEMHKLYKSGDEDTITRLAPLFGTDNSPPTPQSASSPNGAIASSANTESIPLPDGENDHPPNSEMTEMDPPANAIDPSPVNVGTEIDPPANANDPSPVNAGTAIISPAAAGTPSRPIVDTAPDSLAIADSKNDSTTARRPRKREVLLKKAKTIPFVHFQQTIIRDRIANMSDEEMSAVEEFIENSYSTALEGWKRPWLELPAANPDEDLKTKFYQK